MYNFLPNDFFTLFHNFIISDNSTLINLNAQQSNPQSVTLIPVKKCMTNNPISTGKNIKIITRTPSNRTNTDSAKVLTPNNILPSVKNVMTNNMTTKTSKKTHVEELTTNNIPTKIPKPNTFVPPSSNIIYSTKGAKKSFEVPKAVSQLPPLIIIPPASQETENEPIGQDDALDLEEEIDYSIRKFFCCF